MEKRGEIRERKKYLVRYRGLLENMKKKKCEKIVEEALNVIQKKKKKKIEGHTIRSRRKT